MFAYQKARLKPCVCGFVAVWAVACESFQKVSERDLKVLTLPAVPALSGWLLRSEIILTDQTWSCRDQC